MKVKVKASLDKALIKTVTKYGTKEGVWAALDHLAAVSKQQVPLDQGTLRFSCAVSVNEDGTQGAVSYDTPYAVVQHENTWYRHQRGRKAKYLEDPANDPTVHEEMRQLIKEAYAKHM